MKISGLINLLATTLEGTGQAVHLLGLEEDQRDVGECPSLFMHHSGPSYLCS